MKTLLLILFLLPFFAAAQEVEPILSQDYLSLLKKDSVARNKWIDTSNSYSRSRLRYTMYNFANIDYYRNVINKITITKDSSLELHPVVNKNLTVGGFVSSVIELQRINRLPAVQQQYVQGRSYNGKLTWQGPQTNELFSYGPSINTLEFDGISYPYDRNGKLVAAGTGNGKKITPYAASIFRTAALFSNNATVLLKYKINSISLLSGSISAGQRREKTFIAHNKNNTDHFSSTVTTIHKTVTLTASYDHNKQFFSNNNRNGFLNRVYQNALLSPVSFDNSQGNTIGNLQRSYSLYADNPFFLLENNDHAFMHQQHTTSFNIQKKIHNGRISLFQSLDKVQELSKEGYQPATAFFENGVVIDRNKKDNNYFLNATAEYNIPFTDNDLRGLAKINYNYNNNRSVISYTPANAIYNYQRSSSDISLSYLQTYSISYEHEAGIQVANKMYVSNTTTKDNFFLPSVGVYTRFYNPFNIQGLMIKLKGGFNRFNSELPINNSFAQTNLTQYTVNTALQYLPVKEVNGFDGLAPVGHREYNFGTELSCSKNRIILSADWFIRNTFNDVFPVYTANLPQLLNVANHRNRGMELELNINSGYKRSNQFFISNSILFNTYRSKVTAVREGYNFTPIAGFAEVHKAIVKNAPLGVIVGNSFLKDADNNIIIGTDGFPLVNNTPTVIGDPTPDFILKTASYFRWKKWSLSIGCEWKKGGDVWNGTEAVLDYYGRSAGSAALRNTTGFIFKGVDINGKPSNIPVNFYDPSLPVEHNRWLRYGSSGVASTYIQKGDCIRLNNINLAYQLKLKKYFQQLTCSLYASNIIIWSAYKGVDPDQLLYDQSGTKGLDFFNMPSYHSLGLSVSLKF